MPDKPHRSITAHEAATTHRERIDAAIKRRLTVAIAVPKLAAESIDEAVELAARIARPPE